MLLPKDLIYKAQPLGDCDATSKILLNFYEQDYETREAEPLDCIGLSRIRIFGNIVLGMKFFAVLQLLHRNIPSAVSSQASPTTIFLLS
jgi:hypothetical protein